MHARKLTILLAVGALGVSSMVTQLTLMRELLCVFSGNEMVFGIVLANWLLLTGLGSAMGRSAGGLRQPMTVLILALILVAVLPVGSVLAVRTLRNVVFIRGAMIGVAQTVASCFVLLLPYCLTSGYLLTLACSALAKAQRDQGAALAGAGPASAGPASIGQVYLLDSVGTVVGGLLFTFVLIHVLRSHFGCLYVPAFGSLLAAGVAAVVERRKVLLGAVVAVAAGLGVLVSAVDLDKYSTRIEHAGFDVVFRGNSPYGSLVVTRSAGQFNFIENGLPLFSTHNVDEVEETVHYAMAQRPAASRVLLISGGVSGTAREILKYPHARVDYVELDPLIVEVGTRYLPEALADARIRVREGDGRSFLRRAGERYDVIITDVPEPSTSQANRYYTREFFQEANCAMNHGGVLCLALGRYENYVSRELARQIGTARRTLGEAFGNILVVPGGRLFLLASNGELTADIAGGIERAGVRTQLMTRGYLSAMLSRDRMADVTRAASADAPVNTDFSPVLYYYNLLYWLSRFKVSFGVLEGILLAVLAVYLIRIRAVPFAIFTGGFAASALEVVLLLGFQILYGSVYHGLGLIVTMFMAGLAVGSLVMNRVLPRRGRRDLAILAFGIAVYAAALPPVLMGLGRAGGALPDAAGSAAFAALTLVLGVLVGMEFPLAGKVDFLDASVTAARLYTADLVGACLGAMLVSTLLVPLIGVTATCLATAGLNAVSGAVLLRKGR